MDITRRAVMEDIVPTHVGVNPQAADEILGLEQIVPTHVGVNRNPRPLW